MSLVGVSRQTRPSGRESLQFNALRNWDSQTGDSRCQNLVINYLVSRRGPLRKASGGDCNPPCASAQQRRFSVEPYRHYRCKTLGCHPSCPGSTRCTASKPPCSATQSRSMYRNTTGLSRLVGDAGMPATCCSESGRRFPPTAQGRGAQILLSEPPVIVRSPSDGGDTQLL